jgi:hypothetical protein
MSPEAPYVVDVGIYTVSPGSLILHNTVLENGRYPNAIEVRYESTTAVEVRGSVLDAVIQPRDGANPFLADNTTAAVSSWFADETVGDLHLTPAAVGALNASDPHPECVDDFDATLRPSGSGLTDLGGDEFGGPLFSDGFESGDTNAWDATTG